MQKLLLFFFLFAITLPYSGSAQINYYKLSIGAGAGLSRIQGDLPVANLKETLILNSDLYLSPYINAGLEIQLGKLQGLERDNLKRHFENHYKAISFIGKIHAGALMDQNLYVKSNSQGFRNILKGLYAGTGGGIIFSNQVEIQRLPKNAYTGGLNANRELFLPVCLGIDNSGYGKRLTLGLNYQIHIVLGDQLDGYNIPGGSNDYYSVLSLGLKYKFGEWGLY